ncbi:AMP-binding protein [Geodermatophilus sabuli]|uniref:Acetyl-CoA synthetase n=1 Tax=Geodermatophilus sabuli TaxID=1564158 RepID=A0A285E796_9ACTN|nr:AMP-binding protein [Geodermatophilus sabuli]MBB3082397.1 acetyl-CoA synthetase [Geodermatophilus sabuli]SNX94733.1 acetyl-CoA synthetase [Geodermatophilus sabuli]
MPTTATETYLRARDLLLRHRTDHARAVAEFEWPAFPGPFTWAIDWFDARARGNPAPALWIVEEDGSEAVYSFDEMAARSDRLADLLAADGVGRGDRVLLMLGNQVELWDAVLAIAKLGAVIMPTTTALQTADLADRIERGRARYVIANAADTAKFTPLTAELGKLVVGGPVDGWRPYTDVASMPGTVRTAVTLPEDPLLVYFTSGTTSRPKLVEHSQVSYPVGHLSTMYWIGLQPGDVHLNISSPGWAKHAWSNVFAPWIAEATVFVHNYRRFDAAALLGHIRRCGVTSFCAPPTVWRMLIQADLSGGPGDLREVVAAGEPLNPEVIEQVREQWGLTIRDGFGQTETSVQIANTPGQDVVPGSMGRPLPGVPAVLVDPLTGEPADEGEICLDLSARPVGLMTGYTDDAQRHAEAMAGGYYHTGDVARRDSAGHITYIGRMDDVFKSSDYKISPFELESVLIEHPAVAEAAVVPAPDPVRLAVPKAFVVLAEGWSPDEETARSILAHARERLAPFQRVRRIEFAELPKTISGKIRRVDLRTLEAQRSEGAAPPATEWRDDDLRDRTPSAVPTGAPS